MLLTRSEAAAGDAGTSHQNVITQCAPPKAHAASEQPHKLNTGRSKTRCHEHQPHTLPVPPAPKFHDRTPVLPQLPVVAVTTRHITAGEASAPCRVPCRIHASRLACAQCAHGCRHHARWPHFHHPHSPASGSAPPSQDCCPAPHYCCCCCRCRRRCASLLQPPHGTQA